ncbi:MAG TPA: hypothetical protein VIY53_13255 [Acidobacteriaceae bacterium]
MSEGQEKASASTDPFQPFRELRNSTLDAMAKAMVDTVNSEAYAEATGTMLEGYLGAIAPFREAMEKSMLQTLEHLELPSRQELAALADRFTHIEMRLDDMDAKLDAIGKAPQRNGSRHEPAGGEEIHEPGSAKADAGGKAKARAKGRTRGRTGRTGR